MLLAMKAQQQSYSGLRSPGRSCSAYLCTDSECTKRTDFIYLAYCKKRTLAVPSVRLYRLCNCNRPADCLRKSNRKFSSNLSASSSGKAMHYWNISDFFLTFSKSTGALFCFFLFSMHIFGSILELSLRVFRATEWINKCYFIFLTLKSWFLR